MVVKIFNGKLHSKNINFNISEIMKMIILLKYIKPNLSLIVVDNNFASNLYVRNKVKMCINLNFSVLIFKLSKSIKYNDLINLIGILNTDIIVRSILIQLPLPINLDNKSIINSIYTYKDVDALHPYNMGRHMACYSEGIKSCTPSAIIYFLKSLHSNLQGLNAVLIGMSNIVGKPLVFELFLLGITIFILNKNNKNFSKYINIADIIVVAVGKPDFLSDKHFKSNSIIVDVGINKKLNTIVGDIKFQNFSKTISYITPVPGGIGPLTITRLLKNILLLSI